MPVSTRLVRPIKHLDPNLFRPLSASGPSGIYGGKIFVIKQTSCLPSTGAAPGKKVQRILIYDDHPDSLRLVFGRRTASHVHLPDLPRTTSMGVAFLWILVVGLMMAMLWPLL